MRNDDTIYNDLNRLYGHSITQFVLPRLTAAANDEQPVTIALPGGRLVIDSTQIVGRR